MEKKELSQVRQTLHQLLDSINCNAAMKKAVANERLIYPTKLQQNIIPIIANGEKNLLIKYEDDSGIKLGILLPILNHFLESNNNKSQENIRTAIILAHNKKRINEINDYLNKLITFCSDSLSINVITKTDAINVKALPQVLITNPKILLHLLNKGLKYENISFLVIDQIEFHLQMEFKEELEKIGGFISADKAGTQIIMTVKTVEDSDNQIQEIKKIYMESALVVRFKQSAPLIEEKLMHYYYNCLGKKEEKYNLIYSLIKLNLLYGKTLIKVNTIDDGYKLKLFLSRFGIISQVLNTELPVNTQHSVTQSFSVGHFDFLIIVKHDKNAKYKHVRNAIFFNVLGNYSEYSKIVNSVQFEDGYIVSILDGNEELGQITHLQEKQKEHLGGVQFTELPVKKHILSNFEYRVNDALRSVTPKAIKNEKGREIKKQILRSKKLKTYFEEHPQEKEILSKDLYKGEDKGKNRFQELKNIPDYLMPKESLLANPIEEAIAEAKGQEALASNPTENLYPNEHPDIMSYEKLPPTSGRKLWKIRHHRRIKKKPNKKEINFTPE